MEPPPKPNGSQKARTKKQAERILRNKFPFSSTFASRKSGTAIGNATDNIGLPCTSTSANNFSSRSSTVSSAYSSHLFRERVRRVVVVDACNVMHACASMGLTCTLNNLSNPNCAGLLLVVYKLVAAGFEVKTFIPESYYKLNLIYHFVIERLHQLGILEVIHFNSRQPIHDDELILETALEVGGAVISNDKFHDYVLKKRECNAMLELIFRRIVPYTVEKVSNAPPSPTTTSSEGPGGRRVLAAIKEASHFIGFDIDFDMRTLYADEEDTDYELAAQQRHRYDSKKAEEQLEELELLFSYIQVRSCRFFGLPLPSFPFFNKRWNTDLPHFEGFLRLRDRHREKEEKQVKAMQSVKTKSPPFGSYSQHDEWRYTW